MRRSVVIYILLLLSISSFGAKVTFLHVFEKKLFSYTMITYESMIDATNHRIEAIQKHNQQATSDITDESQQIQVTQAQIDALNTNLKTKLKELDEINKKTVSQQNQLATDSAELNQLKNRAEGQPPLF